MNSAFLDGLVLTTIFNIFNRPYLVKFIVNAISNLAKIATFVKSNFMLGLKVSSQVNFQMPLWRLIILHIVIVNNSTCIGCHSQTTETGIPMHLVITELTPLTDQLQLEFELAKAKQVKNQVSVLLLHINVTFKLGHRSLGK